MNLVIMARVPLLSSVYFFFKKSIGLVQFTQASHLTSASHLLGGNLAGGTIFYGGMGFIKWFQR